MERIIRSLIMSLFLMSCLCPGLNAQQISDYSKTKTLHVIGTSHLDTQWRWTIQRSINEYIPKTFRGNFNLFEKYPDYNFSFEGAIRYMFIKEYYPDDYLKLKKYISDGRWNIAGSSLDAGDVNIPSPESITRLILYGQGFFQKEFGKVSRDIFLPDCFGFGYALPSIAASCGLKGFSTSKLGWGPSIVVPFDLGAWQGVDGSKILAVLKPDHYLTKVREDLSNKESWINKIDKLGSASGLYIGYTYFGTGDSGGAPDEESVSWLDKSLKGTGPLKIISAPSDLLCREITKDQLNKLPLYNGELLLSTHGTGCYTSEVAMKRWNRQNELFADAAEKASVTADWLGGNSYPVEKLHDAWIRFLWHHFHDDITGTSIPEAYSFSWNDELISRKQFLSVLDDAAGAVSQALDTRVKGTAIVVFNPLSAEREDIVEASVSFDKLPSYIRVFDMNGKEVPSQITGRSDKLNFIFLAKVPSVGFAVYDVRGSNVSSKVKNDLKISKESLENIRYLVQLDKNGDISGIFDKAEKRELLESPIRLILYNDVSDDWPAWEIPYSNISAEPLGYVDGMPVVEIAENGPARVSLKVIRKKKESVYIQYIRLATGNAGNKLDFFTQVDWKSTQTLVKAIFPFKVSNPKATYDLGLGTIKRGNNNPRLYEVPAQQWADITNTDGSYGVSILNDCKYGWDKPSDNTLRLTLIHTPKSRSKYGMKDQETQDIGHNTFTYSLTGHKGDWIEGKTQWSAARLNQPLVAFQTSKHNGKMGKSFSFLQLNSDQIMIKALKKAESSDEIVVRLQELYGKPVEDVLLQFATPVVSAREINSAEEPVGNVSINEGKLKVSIGGYCPKSYAVKLAAASAKIIPPQSISLPLDYDLDAVSSDNDRTDGSFNNDGISYPAELLPDTIISEGIVFKMGAKQDGMKNVFTCKGNKIELPNKKNFNMLYILAASDNGDTKANFTVDGKEYNFTIPDFTEKIGQWDSRLVNGRYTEPKEISEESNIITPLTPSYLKKEDIAWYCTHKHNGRKNTNEAYDFCYIFKFAIELPDNAKVLYLPDVQNVKVFAVTLSNNLNDETSIVLPHADEFSRTFGLIER